jgi:hypothetical protein
MSKLMVQRHCSYVSQSSVNGNRTGALASQALVSPLIVIWVRISGKAQKLTLIFTFLDSVTNLTKPMSATLADRRKLSSSFFAFAAFRTHGILDSSLFSLSSTDLAGSVSENAVSRNVGFSALPDSDYIPMWPFARTY